VRRRAGHRSIGHRLFSHSAYSGGADPMANGGSDGLRSSLVKVANGHILEGVL
jgi:hypothetical protein